jgi:predicted Zn-dependent protease
MKAILLLAAISAGMAQTPNGVNFFSLEKEIDLGKNLAAKFQAQEQAQPDARIQSIGDKLAAKTGGAFQYTFFVYGQVSPQYEPIAFPGGPVFVAQSMVSADDSINAAILAHAIAHIALRHYTRQMTQRELDEIGRKAAAAKLGNASATFPIEMRNGQYNPTFEYDADRFAIKLMIDAGYDPQALVRWLQSFPVPKMNLALGDRPEPSARVAAAQRAIEAVRDEK